MSNWEGLGIDWLWGLPESHPFHDAAIEHDRAYDKRRAGLISDETSSLVDTAFLVHCLQIADALDSFYYKIQAYFFYGLARAWGVLRWPDPII